MKNVLVYQMENGREPFNEWFQALDVEAQVKVDDFIFRMATGGSKKNIRALGGGISELKIDYGPGYRVYFGDVDRETILLLLGGDKSTQESDIRKAREYWEDYFS